LKAPFSTIGKLENQSGEARPFRADKTLTSEDHQEREENAGAGRRNRYQVRAVHRGEYYSYRRRNADENSFFCRNTFRFGQWAGEGKYSRSRQPRGVFGKFGFH
jgi:hypothetical protein